MITTTKLSKWLHANRYKNYHLAQTLRIKPATISQWKRRGSIPEKYEAKLTAIMKGEKKLTLRPLKR
jgi:uncharacterized protein YjcR